MAAFDLNSDRGRAFVASVGLMAREGMPARCGRGKVDDDPIWPNAFPKYIGFEKAGLFPIDDPFWEPNQPVSTPLGGERIGLLIAVTQHSIKPLDKAFHINAWLRLLSAEHGEIFVVGDDDQSIL